MAETDPEARRSFAEWVEEQIAGYRNASCSDPGCAHEECEDNRAEARVGHQLTALLREVEAHVETSGMPDEMARIDADLIHRIALGPQEAA